MIPLDALDHRLIAALHADARAPVAKLATILGLSRNTVQKRLDRLVDSGVILGFTLRVRAEHDINQIRAVMMIEVVGKSTGAVIKSLRGLPELYALHTTNGNWDLIAEIRTASLPDFDRVLRQIREIDGVSNSETSLLLSSI
ncbi:AsnC family transcriptional regulator [Elstera cyanobacteriorum]|uniref:AsnC family transcriptional regulator n=1 Tax=Elstera cyanobacteriorum TaxID=2022747 RepID=A0A255XNT3_9PROT|nr:Lrp/AsnC family transcriptional regulator [Elstera cyanobacteriorum]OYQ17920.1 AsnC family transcriptional regulator [Elstera cyanobacteriorum]GFZ85135.1 AsnC family transcriptional regulator [Elstera cyanobacteriorum]